MSQQKIPRDTTKISCAATNIQCSQINKFFNVANQSQSCMKGKIHYITLGLQGKQGSFNILKINANAHSYKLSKIKN